MKFGQMTKLDKLRKLLSHSANRTSRRKDMWKDIENSKSQDINESLNGLAGMDLSGWEGKNVPSKFRAGPTIDRITEEYRPKLDNAVKLWKESFNLSRDLKDRLWNEANSDILEGYNPRYPRLMPKYGWDWENHSPNFVKTLLTKTDGNVNK